MAIRTVTSPIRTDAHLIDASGACDLIAATIHDRHLLPLAVVPATLDHYPTARPAGGIRHLTLVDDGPMTSRARRAAGADRPRWHGSDLIGGVLDRASAQRWRVAVVGGTPNMRETLHRRVMAGWPGVALIGHWTPTPEQVSSPGASAEIAEQLRHTDTDLVIVCVDRASQEPWIETFGEATGARVLLAADTVMDFLTGRVVRVPRWVGRAGLDKMWRLMLEPKRSATRGLIEEPQASLADRRSSAHHDA